MATSNVTAFPTPQAQAISLSTTETATMLRGALKGHFPGVKFSVRSSSYSGGSSISVQWTDGPTYDEVNRVAGRFAGASFDGMIDLKSYQDREIGGQLYSFGADYVFCTRTLSDELVRRATRYANLRYGWTVDPDTIDQKKDNMGINKAHAPTADWSNDRASDIIWRIARVMRPNGILVTVK